jgi:hypothetical protein
MNSPQSLQPEVNFFEKHKGMCLAIIFAIGIVLRIYIAFFTSLPHMHRDSIDYFGQADALMRGGYINYFPNGYPFIIAFVKTISPNATTDILLWLNIVLSFLQIYMAYDIAKRIFGSEKTALLAAIIIAVFPTQINYVRWLTSEVPSSFFLLGGYFFYLRKQNWLSGLCFGLATVIRTELLPIVILIAIIELWRNRSLNIRLAAATAIPMLIVAGYCYMKTGNFSIAGHSRVNILLSVSASGSYVDWNFVDKHPEINTSSKATKMYLDHLKADPMEYAKIRMINLWELWGFYPSSSDGNRGTISRIVIGLENFFMLVFGIWGWWRNRRNRFALIMILPFVIVTAVHVLLLALPRYTYTAEPFMIILASWALLNVGRKRLPQQFSKEMARADYSIS